MWFYLYYFKNNPDYVRRLMLEMRVNGDFVKFKSYKSFKILGKKILHLLKEGQEKGLIRKNADIYCSRYLLLGTLEHVVTRWLLNGEKYDLMQFADQVSELVLDGIRAK